MRDYFKNSRAGWISFVTFFAMKILLANKFFFLRGGSERVFFAERGCLEKRGVEVVDFSMKDQRNFYSPYTPFFVSKINYHESVGPLSAIKQAAKFVHSPEATRKARSLVERERPDIAHLHNIYHQLTPSIIPVLKRHGVKVVLTLHDGKLICPGYLMLDRGNLCTSCIGQSFWKPIFKNCQESRIRSLLLSLEAYWHSWAATYDQVDLFLSPSFFLANLVSKRVPKTRVQILRNGLPLDMYTYSPRDQGYALYFGRLSKEKGITTLLRAYRELDNALPLKVVGAGPLEAELRKHDVRGEFLGFKSGENLKRILAAAAFVIVPSEWYENCPMVVLEAMAMGKPVIASRIGGIPEQIDDGQTGFLFEMGNIPDLVKKIRFLSADVDMRRKMGMAARKKAEREYSLDVHCDQLIGIYEALLCGK
jgi:glycosyltransferase involved in cell wall biosynthesis